jgi:hypothetical protein
MPVMMEKLYDALRAGNVPDDKARAAAIEAADRDIDLANVRADLRLLKWMVGTNAAVTLAVLGIVLQILLRGGHS